MRPATSFVVLAALALVAVQSATQQISTATAATCGATITDTINGATVRARSISTYRTSCTTGRRVLRSFLAKADRHESCNRASKRPPPTNGCRVRGFNCFRNGSTYCASPGGKSVMWRE